MGENAGSAGRGAQGWTAWFLLARPTAGFLVWDSEQ